VPAATPSFMTRSAPATNVIVAGVEQIVTL
jgi:hypothetical protein